MDDQRITPARKVFAAVLYGSASFVIVIVNKNVLTGHRYGQSWFAKRCLTSFHCSYVVV